MTKGHQQEVSQPVMAHWLLPTTGFPGGQHQEGFRQSRGTSGSWDYWLRNMEHILCSLLNCHFTFSHCIFCLKQVSTAISTQRNGLSCSGCAVPYSTGLFLPVSNKKENFCLWEQTFLILCRWKLVKKQGLIYFSFCLQHFICLAFWFFFFYKTDKEFSWYNTKFL